MRILEDGARFDERDARGFEMRTVNGGKARNLFFFRRDELAPIEPRLRHAPAVTFGISELVGEAAGVDQKLLRYAAANDASAADAEFFRDHHFRAIARRNARGAHPARTRSNDEEIDVKHKRGFRELRCLW